MGTRWRRLRRNSRGCHRCLIEGRATPLNRSPGPSQALQELDAAALRLNATPAQIAIAWLLAQPGITAPIVSVTSVDQLEEISGATDIALDGRTLMRLDLVSA